jgi:hypothetical protein
VVTPKSISPSEIMALTSAKKFVHATGPTSRSLVEQFLVAIQGYIRRRLYGKPIVTSIPAASMATMPTNPRTPVSMCRRR